MHVLRHHFASFIAFIAPLMAGHYKTNFLEISLFIYTFLTMLFIEWICLFSQLFINKSYKWQDYNFIYCNS